MRWSTGSSSVRPRGRITVPSGRTTCAYLPAAERAGGSTSTLVARAELPAAQPRGIEICRKVAQLVVDVAAQLLPDDHVRDARREHDRDRDRRGREQHQRLAEGRRRRAPSGAPIGPTCTPADPLIISRST